MLRLEKCVLKWRNVFRFSMVFLNSKLDISLVSTVFFRSRERERDRTRWRIQRLVSAVFPRCSGNEKWNDPHKPSPMVSSKGNLLVPSLIPGPLFLGRSRAFRKAQTWRHPMGAREKNKEQMEGRELEWLFLVFRRTASIGVHLRLVCLEIVGFRWLDGFYHVRGIGHL